MIDGEPLRHLAERLVLVPGITAVLLGGSRARNEHTPESDVDIGLYYRPPLDVTALGDLARAVAGADAQVSRPGDWGPWVDGGGWLRIDGTAVDWIYRDLDRVHSSWDAAVNGRYTFHAQVGHPLGVPDFAYAGEVAVGAILADPTGELSEIRDAAGNYPTRLGEALAAGLWEADFVVDNARKAVTRRDATYVAGCLFRAVCLCAHALHGKAGRWLINEKGAVASAGRLSVAPPHFATRAHGVLAHLGTDPDDLRSAVTAIGELVAETTAACQPAPHHRER